MPTSTLLLLALLGIAALPSEASAADPVRCLSSEQRRAAVASNQAVPLARAIRGLKAHLGGEVVRARLCESASGLVYMLTVLARDGKVTRPTVDALKGTLLGGG